MSRVIRTRNIIKGLSAFLFSFFFLFFFSLYGLGYHLLPIQKKHKRLRIHSRHLTEFLERGFGTLQGLYLYKVPSIKKKQGFKTRASSQCGLSSTHSCNVRAVEDIKCVRPGGQYCIHHAVRLTTGRTALL